MNDLREKLLNNIAAIGENYLIDKTVLKIAGNKKIENWNTTALMLSCMLRSNALLIGEPGSGKTSAMSVVSSVYDRLPADFMRATMINGHPEQTEEKMTGRPDFGVLNKEAIEKVIWGKAIYGTVIRADEFNRLPIGKQGILLDVSDSSRVSYLNDDFFRGEKAFFATINHSDGGNYDMTPPQKDRFAMALEYGHQGSLITKKFLLGCSKNIKSDLYARELTQDLLKKIKNNKGSIDEKLSHLANFREKSWPKMLNAIKDKNKDRDSFIQPITFAEYDQMVENMEAIEVSPEATVFSMLIDAEHNITPTYGSKRSCDPIDEANHNKYLANFNCVNGLSARASETIDVLGKAVAYLLGDKVVTESHIKAITPYITGHRLLFTEDFEAQHTGDNRDCYLNHYLAQQLVDNIDKTWQKQKNFFLALENLGLAMYEEGQEDYKKTNYFKKQLDSGTKSQLSAALERKQAVDHPLAKEYVNFINPKEEN